MLTRIKDIVQGKTSLTTKRSSKWPKVRAAHLKINPLCAVCEGKVSISVHHIHPFHTHPDLELEPTNLITLCECKKYGVNCHLLIGHLGNFTNINADVIDDVATWNAKLKKDNTNLDSQPV
jgi:5-methylcytosine-specific restriction protein A